MTTRNAACSCGQLRLTCTGEPVRTCGSTVYWELVSAPDVIAVAVGNFADPHFPKPRHSVYEERRHSWVDIDDDGSIEHLD